MVGQRRQGNRDQDGHQNAHGSNGGVEDHVLGAMGEMFFAKVTGRYPSGLFVGMDDDNDVGGIQVRTRRKDFMDLYLWENDPTDCLWALVTGEGPEFRFWGVIAGSLAASPAFWTDAADPFPREGCWVVPKEALWKRLK